MPLDIWKLIAAVGVGLIGGFTSGLLGVSPGGGLVVFSSFFLGADQHLAQGISLIAQVAPTSLSGIKRYRKNSAFPSYQSILWLGFGFLAAGPVGAFVGGKTPDQVLRWAFVGYLVFLAILLLVKSKHRTENETARPNRRPPNTIELIIVGMIAGFSSGFLGIGGGLAITVCLSAWLKVPQHQAQVMSLIMAIVPTTLPAAIVYWKQGWAPSWPIMIAVLSGLWFGTDLGARIANRLDERRLKKFVIVFAFFMAGCMAFKALGG